MKLFFLLFSWPLWGTVEVIVDQELPYEARALFSSLGSTTKIPQIKKIISRQNALLGQLEKGEYYFIIKTEIYKGILEIPPGEHYEREGLQLDEEARKRYFALMEGFREDLPFISWMGPKLLQDYDLTGRKVFTPWIYYLSNYPEEEIREKFELLGLKLLQRINEKMKFYLMFDKRDRKGDKEFVSFKTRQGPPQEAKVEKVVEKILNNLQEKGPPQDLFPRPDPHYIPPVSLPTPLEAWN